MGIKLSTQTVAAALHTGVLYDTSRWEAITEFEVLSGLLCTYGYIFTTVLQLYFCVKI